MSEIAPAKLAETAIFAQCCGSVPAAVFLLGAPRTGSTVLYQAWATCFGLPYLSNLTNDHFSETPIVGLALQKAVPVTVGYASRFGKTTGAFQPSEGSAVMAHWFGGGHPSQTVSTTILAGREPHLVSTLAACNALYGKPLAVKNAWNCFRIDYLAAALPQARFIWIRRDIAKAALSDLEARYETQGSAEAWNSATPSNLEALRALPPAAQVVENQYEFNRAIGASLRAAATGRWAEIWYEDFLDSPEQALERAGGVLGLTPISAAPAPAVAPGRGWRLGEDEKTALQGYVRAQGARLEPYRRRPSGMEAQ